MKVPVLLILLFFVVGISAWSYHNKFSKTEDDIDRLETALRGAKDVVPPGSAIGFAGNVDITIRSQCRYILAPGIVLADNKDTALVMYPLQDSAIPAGPILWEHVDDRYKYFIATGYAQ